MPLLRRAGTPFNTMLPGPRSASVASGFFIHPAVWPQQTWTKNLGGGGCALFFWVAGSPSNTVARAYAYLHTKWHLSPSSRLAATHIGRKLESCAPLGEEELGPHLTQSRVGRAYLCTKWHLDPCSRLPTIDVGRKLRRGMGPHRTQSPLG